MNDAHNGVNSNDGVDGDPSEPLCIADLGDAVEETKQWSWYPWVFDNYLQLGWEG